MTNILLNHDTVCSPGCKCGLTWEDLKQPCEQPDESSHDNILEGAVSSSGQHTSLDSAAAAFTFQIITVCQNKTDMTNMSRSQILEPG